MKKIHCPWCSKTVGHRAGRLTTHLTPGGKQQCAGTGQPVSQAALVNRNINRRLGWGVDGIPKGTYVYKFKTAVPDLTKYKKPYKYITVDLPTRIES